MKHIMHVMTPAEIESSFGLSAGTVRQWLNKNTQKLAGIARKADDRTWILDRDFAIKKWGKIVLTESDGYGEPSYYTNMEQAWENVWEVQHCDVDEEEIRAVFDRDWEEFPFDCIEGDLLEHLEHMKEDYIYDEMILRMIELARQEQE